VGFFVPAPGLPPGDLAKEEDMSLFSFPAQVNERAARLVAATVAVGFVAAFLTKTWWVAPLLGVGFLLRFGWGPKVSPLARAAMALAAKLGPAKPVAGPPKRFAQGVGAACSLVATALFLSGFATAAWAVVGLVVVFATLEATVAFCMGCWVYGHLQAAGVFPPDACVDCGVIARRSARSEPIRPHLEV
jgi:hypothetical protein